MQLMKIFKQDAHVIHHVGALRMARQKRSLPRAHVLIEIVAQLRDFAAQALEFSGGNVRPRHALQVGQFPFQLVDFVFPRVFGHMF